MAGKQAGEQGLLIVFLFLPVSDWFHSQFQKRVWYILWNCDLPHSPFLCLSIGKEAAEMTLLGRGFHLFSMALSHYVSFAFSTVAVTFN